MERESGTLHYVGPDGKPLTTEGYRSLKPVEANGEKTYHAEVFFPIYGSHEALYGLGQHQAGVWNYRGETIDLSQENTQIVVSAADLNKWIRNLLEQFAQLAGEQPIRSFALHQQRSRRTRIDYYFIYGPEADQIIAEYRELTGEVPPSGRWPTASRSAKNKYQAQAEIEGVAAKYCALHPSTNIVQDWFWWVTMGEMKWNPHYPQPAGHDRQAA